MNALLPAVGSDAVAVAQLPHNLEAEQALLGALMFDNAA
jgi:replicative DNA helicase